MREDSPEIALLQFNLRTFGASWLETMLSLPIRKILSRKASVETDPSRLTPYDKDTLKRNLDSLLHCASSIINAFSPSMVKDIPSQIINSCQIIHETTNKKFPDAHYRALVSYLFLRFICPAISAPEKYNIVKKGSVSRDARRKLILVAKVIQSVVNNAPCNESYMSKVDDFAREKFPQLDLFFSAILKVRHCFLVSDSSVP